MASTPAKKETLKGKGLKIASHTLGQWLLWHVSVIGTEQVDCSVSFNYNINPFKGGNCLSWTVWASLKAVSISKMPI